MPEIILRTHVFDRSGDPAEDTTWERTVEVGFLPGENDSVQLWGDDNGPLAPVKQRWWRPDGRICVELVSVVNNGSNGSQAMKDGRLQWVPLHQRKRDLVRHLRGAGWQEIWNG